MSLKEFPIDKKLQEKGVFVIHKSISDYLVDELIGKILEFSIKKPSEKIYILFMSGGGAVKDALTLYDILKTLPNQTIGINMGRCDSAAIAIYAGCKIRQALPNSRFVMHAMSNSFTIKSTSDEEHVIEVNREMTKEILKDFREIHEKEFNMSTETFWRLCKDGEEAKLMISASKAKDYGIVHEIVTEVPLWV